MNASLEEASDQILAALHRRRNLEGFDDLALSVTCGQGAGCVADATVIVDVGAASNDSANLVRLAIGGGSHQGGIAIVVALYGLCDLDVGYLLNGGWHDLPDLFHGGRDYFLIDKE